jgi:hypothetical protein
MSDNLNNIPYTIAPVDQHYYQHHYQHHYHQLDQNLPYPPQTSTGTTPPSPSLLTPTTPADTISIPTILDFHPTNLYNPIAFAMSPRSTAAVQAIQPPNRSHEGHDRHVSRSGSVIEDGISSE